MNPNAVKSRRTAPRSSGRLAEVLQAGSHRRSSAAVPAPGRRRGAPGSRESSALRRRSRRRAFPRSTRSRPAGRLVKAARTEGICVAWVRRIYRSGLVRDMAEPCPGTAATVSPSATPPGCSHTVARVGISSNTDPGRPVSCSDGVHRARRRRVRPAGRLDAVRGRELPRARGRARGPRRRQRHRQVDAAPSDRGRRSPDRRLDPDRRARRA